MKKMFAVLLALSVLATLSIAALAASEPTAQIVVDTAVETDAETEIEMDLLLEGTVTEIVDGGFILMDQEQGEVAVNTSEATVWDGLLAEEELAVGQYVFVDFNGTMTLSLPPQTHADRVSTYTFTGMVSEKLEDGSILVTDGDDSEVIVHLGEDMTHANVGSPITVYHNGVMTASLPAQITASAIELPLLSGEIIEMTDGGFLMITEDGEQEYQVNLGEETLYSIETSADAELAEGEQVELAEGELTVEADDAEPTESEEAEPADDAEPAESEETELSTDAEPTESEEAELADDAEPAESEEAELADDAEPTESEEAELADDAELTDGEETELSAEAEKVELNPGDKVTVYYNGATTRSLPPQIFALEVVICR